VSILIAAGAGMGRCFGSLPRAKVSMMNMRPPQQGHGRGSMRGSSAAGASEASCCSERTGTASSSRDVGGAAAAGQQSVVPDAVEVRLCFFVLI